jgi:gluconolactonase
LTRIAVVADGVGRCEGPVVRRSGELAFVSMSHGCVYAAGRGGARVLARTGGAPNGLAEARDGSLFAAQMERPGGVQRIGPDGAVGWLSRAPASPNDLCFGPDGLLYVTDPARRPWGEGAQDGRLWRCDPASGEAELLLEVDYFPNGIGFGLEDDALYVASTSGAEILRYPLAGGRLGAPEAFARLGYGEPDGFAFGADGTLVVCAIRRDGAPGELQAYDRDGALLDRLRPGPHALYTNVALAPTGEAFVTCTDAGHVLAIGGWAHAALPLHPFRGH